MFLYGLIALNSNVPWLIRSGGTCSGAMIDGPMGCHGLTVIFCGFGMKRMARGGGDIVTIWVGCVKGLG